MREETDKKRLEALYRDIAKYNKAFFQEGRSLISDYQYDLLVAELKSLEGAYPQWKRPNTPTERVGEATLEDFPTVPHQRPMYSLANTYDRGEVEAFMARVEKRLPDAETSFYCELKVDGLALSLIYRKGRLHQLITRGDGKEGSDITINKRLIGNIPLRLKGESFPSTLEVRGEAYMTFASFAALNKENREKGDPLFSNPRNATAGILRTKKPSFDLRQPLSFLPYGLYLPASPITTQEENFERLKAYGLQVSANQTCAENLADIFAYIDRWERGKSNLPMAIDGIVIKVNSLGQQEELGYTAKSPRWAVAYKYKPTSATTELEDVCFQISRYGILTPVGIFKPTLLAGSVVRRATLHNAQILERLNLHRGDTIIIVKGGDVIPKVIGVEQRQPSSDKETFAYPTRCPGCNTPIEEKVLAGHIQYYCPNDKKCRPQKEERLAHFVSRQALDIRHLGKRTLALLLREGRISRPSDLFQLTVESFHGLEGFQDKSIQNILNSIQEAKKMPFERVLFALGIPHVGKVIAERLTGHFPTIDALRGATEEELLAVHTIGNEIAASVHNYFADLLNEKEVAALRASGLTFDRKMPIETHRGGFLEGKKIVITGTYKNRTREEVKAYIKAHGGTIVSQVSAKTDFLLAGHAPGPKKVEAADALRISIITEEALHSMQKKAGPMNEPAFLLSF